MTGFFDIFKNLFKGSSKSKSIEERLSAIEEHLGFKPTKDSVVDEEAPLMEPEPLVELSGDVKPPMSALDKPPGDVKPPMGGLDKPPMSALDKPPGDVKPPMGGLDNPLQVEDNKQEDIKTVGGRKNKKGTRKGKRPKGKKTRSR